MTVRELASQLQRYAAKYGQDSIVEVALLSRKGRWVLGRIEEATIAVETQSFGDHTGTILLKGPLCE